VASNSQDFRGQFVRYEVTVAAVLKIHGDPIRLITGCWPSSSGYAGRVRHAFPFLARAAASALASITECDDAKSLLQRHRVAVHHGGQQLHDRPHRRSNRDLLASGLGDLDQPGMMESSKHVGVTEEGGVPINIFVG
jgi:hypothetical protein